MKTKCPKCGASVEFSPEIEKYCVCGQKINDLGGTKSENHPRMAEVKCPHCKKYLTIPIAALNTKKLVPCAFCRKMFIPEPSKRKKELIWGISVSVIVIAAVIGLLCWMWTGYFQSKEFTPENIRNKDLCEISEKAIHDVLLNPSSAKYQPSSECKVEKTGSDTWIVELWCDATNVLGGVVRTTYRIEVNLRYGKLHGKILDMRAR